MTTHSLTLLKHRDMAVSQASEGRVTPDVERQASNPATPPATLTQLALDPGYGVRYHIARNPATPPATLRQLLADPSAVVQWAAADNPRLPRTARALWELAHQPHPRF